MSLPIRQLPVLQQWDCHVSGNCCKEYQVALTEEEHQRIEGQGWENDPAFAGVPLFTKHGLFGGRQWKLNRREDGSCVFLSPEGRCRIHERFGAEAKPLPCRLFPFILVPAGDHWRVGVRFACPSAAASKGRAIAEHEKDLRDFAHQLAEREGLTHMPGRADLPPPLLQSGQRVDWSDLLRFGNAVLTLVRSPGIPVERRLRKCLALANLCRQSRFDKVQGGKISEFLHLVSSGLDNEAPVDPALVPRPSWTGRLLFRQMLALFARKDQGPKRGLAAKGKIALLSAAWRFALGRGPVPLLNGFLPETTFEQVEAAQTALSPEAEEILERYYSVKVASMQFCGGTNFGLPFWDGLEMLLATFPCIAWLTRALARPGVEGLLLAVSLVDDHFGFNRILGSFRQKLAFRLLARNGDLARLIAWYGR